MSGPTLLYPIASGLLSKKPVPGINDPALVLASDYDRDTQALRAEIERYIQEGIKISDQRDELRAQVEVMRADAERWNKMKSNVMGGSMGLPGGWICADEIDEWDQIIDGLPAALQAKP